MLSLNILSSSYKFPAQGVETAFRNHLTLLEHSATVKVNVNSLKETTDIIHLHTPDPKFFMHLYKNRKESLLVISAHVVPDSVVGSLKGARLWLPFFSLYLKKLYNFCDIVLAVSEDVLLQLKKFGIKEEKLRLFPNFVIRKEFETNTTPKEKKELRKNLNLPENSFIVIGAGQIQPRKGIDDFISLGEKLGKKGFVFLWCGGMPFKGVTSEYEKTRKKLLSLPENVLFPGIIPREKMKDYYRASDCFFLPSYQETFGLVVPEAAGSKIPVVLRDLEVYREIFKNYYLKGNDLSSFEKIFFNLKDSEQFYSEWKSNSENLFELYTEEKRIKEILDIYREGYEKKFMNIK